MSKKEIQAVRLSSPLRKKHTHSVSPPSPSLPLSPPPPTPHASFVGLLREVRRGCRQGRPARGLLDSPLGLLVVRAFQHNLLQRHSHHEHIRLIYALRCTSRFKTSSGIARGHPRVKTSQDFPQKIPSRRSGDGNTSIIIRLFCNCQSGVEACTTDSRRPVRSRTRQTTARRRHWKQTT